MDKLFSKTNLIEAAENPLGSPFLHSDVVIPLPIQATLIIDALEAEGFKTWVVGGYIRDFLLGEISSDIDMASAAHWRKASLILKKAGFAVHETGTKHGTITVTRDGFNCEITTFRSEGEYDDHRHPNDVTFVETIEEDLKRRDFTINALAYHPKRGLLDMYGGISDIRDQFIRCVGDPEKRFKEDPLRIMRAVRISAQTGFNLEENTSACAERLKELLSTIAAERLQAEFTKLLCGQHVENALNYYVDILGVIIPELLPMKGFSQHNKWHNLDVLQHTSLAVAKTQPVPLNRWAALFHDIGKPKAFVRDENGVGHMTGHPAISAEIATKVAKRLRFSNKLIHDLVLLVENHEARPIATQKSVRKLYNKLNCDEQLFHSMIDLMIADARAHAPWCVEEIVARMRAIESLFIEMIEQDAVFSIKDLPIKGDDLLALGIPQGPQIGNVLNEILQAVHREEIPCDRMVLLDYAKRFRPSFFD